MIKLIERKLIELEKSNLVKQDQYLLAKKYYLSGFCQVLTHAKSHWDVLVNLENGESEEWNIQEENEHIFCFQKKARKEWTAESIASLMQIRADMFNTQPKIHETGKTYTREGMRKRVLEERRDKARNAKYRITFADNIFGEHTLTNERGVKYKITLRDFENETGYINNPDLKTNKLGTTKHIMFAFDALRNDQKLFNKLDKSYPFLEIFLDPLNEYRITWFYPEKMTPAEQSLIKKNFGKQKFIKEDKVKDFLNFLVEATEISSIKIRPEVEEKVRDAWDLEILDSIKKNNELDFSLLKTELFPYQKRGVQFATFRKGAIIADEMGLGKTLQAIATAVMKKSLLGFSKTLIICPASLKEQWKQEIEKFSNEKATVVEGFPEERAEIYRTSDAYFLIVNYETVLRDLKELNKINLDFIILDEAQRIKNFSTLTAQNIKKLNKKHGLVITGTPIENRLIDLYSVMGFLDSSFLGPLWEFSYQHCYFDVDKKDKIVGYYNLKELNKKLQTILIRREKSEVIKELPKVTELTVPVKLHPDQADYHASYAKGVASILRKKYISPFDLQKLTMLLNSMRMVCDSTYLIDKETYISPKLDELKHILIEKLDMQNSPRKIIIFSEWVNMLNLIAQMLREIGIGYAMLTGKVAVKNRDKLIKKFEKEPSCQIFLSTEAGGSGLNLQVADTVINFELPWNPAKKNQRIGRIDRIGQRNTQLTVINLITKGSIEMNIASGLSLKQNLFDGVLSENGIDEVDFSAAGRAQFLMELQNIIDGLAEPAAQELEEETPEPENIETITELIAEDETVQTEETPAEPDTIHPEPTAETQVVEMEKVLNNGMDFLSGLLKMATGKDVGLENKKVEVDKETGEVVMRFKLPGF